MNKGAEVDSLNNDKRTALHIAVLNRKIDIVASLVKVSSAEHCDEGEIQIDCKNISVREGL